MTEETWGKDGEREKGRGEEREDGPTLAVGLWERIKHLLLDMT